MKHRSGASKSHHKDGHGGGKEVKYSGVTRQASGRYSANICKTFLGMFATAEEAARAYDRAAFASRGHMVILNFPAEYSGAVAAAANASINAATSSSSMATRKELKLECVDKLKEDLLDPDNAKIRSESM